MRINEECRAVYKLLGCKQATWAKKHRNFWRMITINDKLLRSSTKRSWESQTRKNVVVFCSCSRRIFRVKKRTSHGKPGKTFGENRPGTGRLDFWRKTETQKKKKKKKKKQKKSRSKEQQKQEQRSNKKKEQGNQAKHFYPLFFKHRSWIS